MRSGGSYEHFAKGKRGKREVETRLGIQSINLLKIFIVKCPEPNTTKNPPLHPLGRGGLQPGGGGARGRRGRSDIG